MRTIGIDLAIKATHKAVVVNANGKFVTPVISFQTRWDEIAQVVARAREGVASDYPLRAVMEPTGMVWLSVATALRRLNVTPYLVNGQRSHDLRRFYKRHSSSDRIAARVLAKMPIVDEESLYPLEIPSAMQFACQRGCKELNRLRGQITAIKNRMRDSDRFAWPGLESVFEDIFSPATRLFRQIWYDPARVVSAGVDEVRRTFRPLADQEEDLAWVEHLLRLATEVLTLYGTDAVDYDLFQREVYRDQRLLVSLEDEADLVWRETVRPLYHRLHPGRHLETLYGVGEQSAAVYTCFVGRAARFPTNRKFRGWHGLVPDSRQSGNAESKGLRVSQAGPDLVKKYAFLGGGVARRFDPQIAGVYYNQMMHKGKHFNQAICACATHLLDRIRVILLQDRPYELRDVDGTPVTPEQARAIIAERYTVPEEVRVRNNRRVRRERAARRAERQHQRRQQRRSRSRM